MRGGPRLDRRRVLVLAVVLATVVLVGLAGCTSRPEESEQPTITVLNDSLSVDPGVVFGRLERLLDTDATPPETLRAYETIAAYREALGASNGTQPIRLNDELLAYLGLDETDDPAAEEVTFAGRTSTGGQLLVVPGENASRQRVTFLTAHELTHYIHFQQGRSGDLARSLGRTTDDRFVARSVVEGAAILATDAYMREYEAGDVLNSPLYDRVVSVTPPGHSHRWAHARYVYGHRYVRGAVDGPTDLEAVFEEPPRTSEQVLHGVGPGTEPPAPMTVSVETGPDWRAVTTDRLGEATVRYALENGLPPERAARAAHGWGNDSLHVLRPLDGGNRTFAWVLRWDDPGNATEFVAAARDSLEARGRPVDDGDIWRLSSGAARLFTPGERTTVLAFGAPDGLQALAVSTSGSSVRLRAGSAAG